MKSRTPIFIISGLIIIILLLGFYYMSCASASIELRQTANQFEDRVRVLALKTMEAEKIIEAILNNRRVMEKEKTSLKTQIEKKSWEINSLNKKLNKTFGELQSLKSDKINLEEQIIELKNISETLIAKNSAIRKVQNDVQKEKKSNQQQLNVFMEQLNVLKQQIESYKHQSNQSENLSKLSKEPLPPVISSNENIQKSPVTVTPHINQKLNNLDGQEGERQPSLNDLLRNIRINKINSEKKDAQMVVNTTSVLNLSVKNPDNDPHMHIDEYEDETEANKNAEN